MPIETAIDITLNGASSTVASDASVADVLRGMNLDPTKPKGIAVAVNDEVVPKSAWQGRQIQEKDRVEVITARQGG